MRGFTLIELIVALAILGLLGGMSALAFARLQRPDATDRVRLMAAAQRAAVKRGQSVRLVVDGDTILFLPDDRAVGRGVDPLTGIARGR